MSRTEEDYIILREIQKNTEMGMRAINMLTERTADHALRQQIENQGVRYSEFHNRATKGLLAAKQESYQPNKITNLMLSGSVFASTIFDTSNSHIAELMIQGSNRGITDMYKYLKHNNHVSNDTIEFAKELMDFEERSIEALRSYL